MFANTHLPRKTRLGPYGEVTDQVKESEAEGDGSENTLTPEQSAERHVVIKTALSEVGLLIWETVHAVKTTAGLENREVIVVVAGDFGWEHREVSFSLNGALRIAKGT